jgi:hypothetical protein
MGYEALRLCSGGGGFEAVPRPRAATDLLRLRREFEARSIPVTDARVMLIARMQQEVTIARDGRVLIKSRTSDEAAAIWAELEPMLTRAQVASA